MDQWRGFVIFGSGYDLSFWDFRPDSCPNLTASEEAIMTIMMTQLVTPHARQYYTESSSDPSGMWRVNFNIWVNYNLRNQDKLLWLI